MRKDQERALELAGLLAYAAARVVNASALTVGPYLVELNKRLRDYDDHIVAMAKNRRGRKVKP